MVAEEVAVEEVVEVEPAVGCRWSHELVEEQVVGYRWVEEAEEMEHGQCGPESYDEYDLSGQGKGRGLMVL